MALRCRTILAATHIRSTAGMPVYALIASLEWSDVKETMAMLSSTSMAVWMEP